MKSMLTALFAMLLIGCSSPHLQDEERARLLTLSEPVLVYEVFQIPTSGTANRVSGPVELMSEGNEWVALQSGARLSGGTRIHIAAGGYLSISFRRSEKLELRESAEDRWLVLEDPGAR